MITIQLPDKTKKEFPKGTTSLDVAKSISEGLARNVLAAEINGEIWDANRFNHKDHQPILQKNHSNSILIQ